LSDSRPNVQRGPTFHKPIYLVAISERRGSHAARDGHAQTDANVSDNSQHQLFTLAILGNATVFSHLGRRRSNVDFCPLVRPGLHPVLRIRHLISSRQSHRAGSLWSLQATNMHTSPQATKQTHTSVTKPRCCTLSIMLQQQSVTQHHPSTTTTTRHTASTSMYVMLPERHQWKPAVQTAAVMLRTPPVDG